MLIGYMRVSTAGERQSTDLQLDALVGAGIDARQVFSDHASGARSDRPGLQACLDYLQPGDTLVVWKLDRLGRSLSHLIAVVEGLRARSIALRSLTEALDTSTPQGELLFNMFGALAQFERALIVERITAGLEAAARRGRRGGRPRAIDPEKLEQIEIALKEGTSKAAVCRTFGVKRSTLIDALNRGRTDGGSDTVTGDTISASVAVLGMRGPITAPGIGAFEIGKPVHDVEAGRNE